MKGFAATLCFFILFASFFVSCKKDAFTSNPNALLTTTTDTLHFDTVFTSTGSVTQSIKLFNLNGEGIVISSVKLGGGASSPFKINVAGTPGPVATNISIKGGDSTYIFATVSINPSNQNLPFIVRDSIEITYNGNTKWVQLQAFGQNAHFIKNATIRGTTTWNNDLPYVITGGLTVDTNAVLIINKGCAIFVNAAAPIIINGTLQVRGEKEDSNQVVFTSDRLDEPYRDYPASFPGLTFAASSKNNSLTYATIKNAVRGIVVLGPSVNANPKLSLAQTIITNAYDVGLMGINTSISAQNTLVTNSGKNLVLNGGQYQFIHCTVASQASEFIPHTNPLLAVSNEVDGVPVALSAVFQNCIFWAEGNGQVPDEVVILKKGSTPFLASFENLLWRVQTTPANATTNGSIINQQSPLFDGPSEKEPTFRLKEDSPAIGKGSASGVVVDLDGAPRPVGLPDLGAFERQ